MNVYFNTLNSNGPLKINQDSFNNDINASAWLSTFQNAEPNLTNDLTQVLSKLLNQKFSRTTPSFFTEIICRIG